MVGGDDALRGIWKGYDLYDMIERISFIYKQDIYNVDLLVPFIILFSTAHCFANPMNQMLLGKHVQVFIPITLGTCPTHDTFRFLVKVSRPSTYFFEAH